MSESTNWEYFWFILAVSVTVWLVSYAANQFGNCIITLLSILTGRVKRMKETALKMDAEWDAEWEADKQKRILHRPGALKKLGLSEDEWESLF